MDYYYDEGDQIYEDEHFYDEIPNPSFADLYNGCIYPSITQIVAFSMHLFIWNFIFRLTTQTIQIPSNVQHVISAVCGGIVLFSTLEHSSIHCLAFAGVLYLILYLTWKYHGTQGFIVCTFSLLFLFIGEWLTGDSKLWHQIRGTQMIIAMKATSLAFDTDFQRIEGKLNPFEYFGYILCPGNCLLGPWISYGDYSKVYQKSKWSIRSTLWILFSGALSLLLLIISNCLIPDLFYLGTWKWFIAYKDAAAFRFSHYFICFLSQSVMMLAGFGENAFDYISKPWKIEVPRSLVQVVVSWNLPMHIWLKTYIFRVVQPFGSFLAIFSTYIVSALLHGINFQLAAVLISLGFYTYVEYNLRKKLASIYNACILSNACPLACEHKYKWKHPIVLFANVVFCFIVVFHLAYLGVMFEASTAIQEDGYSFGHTLDKWKSLNFASHWLVLITYCLVVLL